MPPAALPAKFRNRITRYEPAVPVSQIDVNPLNWRIHPEYQTGAVETILERIGFVGAVLCRDKPGGRYELIDGHLRRDLSDGSVVPVLVSDLTDQEMQEVLATFDAVGALAVNDQDKLGALLGGLKAIDVPLIDMGWPDFRLEQVLSVGWTPAASPTTAALDAAAAGGDAPPAGPPDPAEPAAPAGHKPFTVPLSVAQELAVRDAIKAAKAKFGVTSSGDALAAIVREWAAGGK